MFHFLTTLLTSAVRQCSVAGTLEELIASYKSTVTYKVTKELAVYPMGMRSSLQLFVKGFPPEISLSS